MSKNETLAMIIAEAKERRNGLPEETFMNRITIVNRVVSQKMGHQHGRKGKPNCAESCEILYLLVMVFDLPNPPNIWNQNRRQHQFMAGDKLILVLHFWNGLLERVHEKEQRNSDRQTMC